MNEYTELNSYKTDNNYVCDKKAELVDRQIRIYSIPNMVLNDKNSLYIEFIANRYCSGIDWTTKTISLITENLSGESDILSPINFRYNDKKIIFGILFDSLSSAKLGELKIQLQVYDDNYIWTSDINNQIKIVDSILTSVVPVSEPNWYQDLVSKISNLENQMQKSLIINTSAKALYKSHKIEWIAHNYDTVYTIYSNDKMLNQDSINISYVIVSGMRYYTAIIEVGTNKGVGTKYKVYNGVIYSEEVIVNDITGINALYKNALYSLTETKQINAGIGTQIGILIASANYNQVLYQKLKSMIGGSIISSFSPNSPNTNISVLGGTGTYKTGFVFGLGVSNSLGLATFSNVNDWSSEYNITSWEVADSINLSVSINAKTKDFYSAYKKTSNTNTPTVKRNQFSIDLSYKLFGNLSDSAYYIGGTTLNLASFTVNKLIISEESYTESELKILTN